MIEIYRIYHKRKDKREKSLKYLCVISAALAAAVLFSVQLILCTFENNIEESIRATNGAEVKVQDRDYLKHEFDQDKLDYLKQTLDEKDYSLAYCGSTNLVFRDKVTAASFNVLNKGDFFLKAGMEAPDEHEAVISYSLAKRMGVQEGDRIYVKLYSSVYEDTEVKIIGILNDRHSFSTAGSEYEIGQEALGSIYLILPDYERFNTAYVEHANQKRIEGLKENFSPQFRVRTLQDLSETVKPGIQLTEAGLKLISCIALIVSNICIAWSFLIYVMHRKKDYLIFKKIGIETKDLTVLLFMEIYGVVLKGILAGIPLGGLAAFGYFRWNGGMGMPDPGIILKSSIILILLTAAETFLSGLIPISWIQQLDDRKQKKESMDISPWLILGITCVELVILWLYVRSFPGFVLLLLIIMIFGLFYFIFYKLFSLAVWLLSKCSKVNFLFVRDLKRKHRLILFPLNLVNICVVVLVILSGIFPILFSDTGNAVTGDKRVIYQSLKSTCREDLFRDKTYTKYYQEKAELLQINGKDAKDQINPEIADDYLEETTEQMKERIIEIYPESDMPKKYQGKNGIFVNNMYRNVYDFKKGDLLTFSINHKSFSCRVAGTYQDASDMDALGFISESDIRLQNFKQKDSELRIIYTFTRQIEDNILAEILMTDKNAQIEKNQKMSDVLKEYMDSQKIIFVTGTAAVGGSGILLVFLTQMMLFVRKKDYYKQLWKIGMSREYLRNHMLIERLMLSVIQLIVVMMFTEPFRFLMNAEFSTKAYTISLSTLLPEAAVIAGINLVSSMLSFWMNRDISS